MMLGTCTKSFGGMSVAETAEIFEVSGLDYAELCFCQKELNGWKYNLCGYEPLPFSSEVAAAMDIFRSHGVSICALGVYNCLWQGSSSDCVDSLRIFREYCDIAFENGIAILATHTGTVLNTANARKSAPDIRKKVFDSFTMALTEAAKCGLTVAVECSPFDILTNYSDFCELKEHIQRTLGTSSMLKYIAVPSSDDRNVDISDIALYHLKDKKRGGMFYERFGEGDADFSDFFADICKASDIPVILEHVNSGNLSETARRVREKM